MSELEKELSCFFGYEDFRLINRNNSDNKSYSLQYTKFKDAVFFDKSSITEFEKRFMRHFYSESHIVSYFNRWYN